MLEKKSPFQGEEGENNSGYNCLGGKNKGSMKRV